MFRIYLLTIVGILSIFSIANAQKHAVGYSPPGPLGKIATGPDTEPPTVLLTETTGLETSGEALQLVKTDPSETVLTLRGLVEDNREVLALKINNHLIPLQGTTRKKFFGLKLAAPSTGRMREYEFTAVDRAGNKARQVFRLSRSAPSSPPALVLLDTDSSQPSNLSGYESVAQSNTSSLQQEAAETDEVVPRPPPPQVLPKIWLFAIGISEFRDKALALDYAASDAASFYKFFRSDKGARLPKTQATLFVNKAATRARIIQSLTRTVKIASANDLVIIFLATHGLPDADTGEINFLMHDTSINNLVATGLSQSDIRRIMERSRAGKILFIIDACHSGELGAGNVLAMRGVTFSEVNRLLTMLAKASDGVAMLTASSSNEASFEGDRWNGGVFTYYLLSGLSGRADSNKDQIVTLREAFDYLYESVPPATQGRQHPELKGQFSNELPLVEVNP